MVFPDQSHINRVRDALWQRTGNGASIMVGSGFSRNAVPTLPNAAPLPTWTDVTRQLYEALYPPVEGRNHPGGMDRGADGMLLIAQEYRAAFGKTALHDELQRMVRDREYQPGPFHERLLQLPWQDVYTTNWDTLLERTRPLVPGRPYRIVSNSDEIPMAERPRIVKLHGSFPAQFPLIITEEDYRTYPAKFAPFVNTVQQAMMETVFLLIGFSGDDPNFLNWSGWVRDNLGPSAPRIYLAGFLRLSQHRRRMLEERNVVPIDVSQHPQAGDWPPNLQHENATSWILHTLERGQPYDTTEWPSPSFSKFHDIPEQLRPVERVNADEPAAEPDLQSAWASSGDARRQFIKEITDAWAQHRQLYPGWLAIPNSSRHLMNWKTDEWGRLILTSLDVLEPVERLYAIRELVWREEILLEPIYSHFETAIEQTLNLIDCENRIVDGEYKPDINWRPIREAWRHIATALLTCARLRSDGEAFDCRIDRLRTFLGEDPDVSHRWHHELCLWAIYNMDFVALDGFLSEWRTEDCDPAWMLRKFALLTEAGHDGEAGDLLMRARSAIETMPAAANSVAGPSREGWTILSMLSWDNQGSLFKRLDELASLKCNALHERAMIADSIKQQTRDDTAPDFDIGRRTITTRFLNNVDPAAGAYRAVRLSEAAGLPPTVNTSGLNMSVSSQILKDASEVLADLNLELATRLVLRSCNSDTDNTLKRVTSRTRIATLTPKAASDLVQSCISAINSALPHVSIVAGQRRNIFWTERMRVAMEVLSRLVLRLDSSQAGSILNSALEWYRNPHLAKEPWLMTTIGNLLLRAWESLDQTSRKHRVLDLLTAPISGLDQFDTFDAYNFPDPGNVQLANPAIPERTPTNEHQWQTALSLIVRGLRGDNNARTRATIRIFPLLKSRSLSADEELQIAEALWSSQHTASEGLPGNTGLYDWGYLILPEPEPGLAQARFRAKWVSQTSLPRDNIQNGGDGRVVSIPLSVDSRALNADVGSLDITLWQIGNAIHESRRDGLPFNFTDEEKCVLVQLVEAWADAPGPERSGIPAEMLQSLWGRRTEPKVRALQGLPAVISEITLSQRIAEKLYSKMIQLNEMNIPAHGLGSSLARTMPSRLDDIATSLRVGLTSTDEALANNAMTALHRWLADCSDVTSHVPQPPVDLVREIGLAIATRRSTALVGALQAATWIFEHGNADQKGLITDLVQTGLQYLATESSYDRDHDVDTEVPLLRLLCAQLAAAMAVNGMANSDIVTLWLKTAQEDPLPEVRRAVPVTLATPAASPEVIRPR